MWVDIGHGLWIQYASKEKYLATDPDWRLEKQIDSMIKDFPITVFSILPEDATTGEHLTEVNVHFSYLDYDIFEVSESDTKVKKLLCITKKSSTRFENIFSKILVIENVKAVKNLGEYLEKAGRSNVYFLFIRSIKPTPMHHGMNIEENEIVYRTFLQNYSYKPTKAPVTSGIVEAKEEPTKKLNFSKYGYRITYIHA